MLEEMLEAVNRRLAVEFGPTSETVYFGPIPGEVAPEADVLRWDIAVSSPAEYDSCGLEQTYGLRFHAYSTSLSTAIRMTDRVWSTMENPGLDPLETSFLKVDKGSDSVEQDPDKTPSGEAIWHAMLDMDVTFYENRP